MKVTVDLYGASSRTRLRCATASHKSALISASQTVQPGISTTLQDHGYGLVCHAMCLFTFPAFAEYSFQPTHRGGAQAEEAWVPGNAPEWWTVILNPEKVYFHIISFSLYFSMRF